MVRNRQGSRFLSSCGRRPVNKETFVGLEVHKSVVVATAMNAQGDKLDQSKLGPSDAELTVYLGRLPGRIHAVLEACTCRLGFFRRWADPSSVAAPDFCPGCRQDFCPGVADLIRRTVFLRQ